MGLPSVAGSVPFRGYPRRSALIRAPRSRAWGFDKTPEEEHMAKPGDVVEVPEIGLRFEFRATAESTGGEYAEVDVIGRPRGFIKAAHVHRGQAERHEVIAGAMEVRFHGRTHVLRAGDAIGVPPDTPHTQRPHGPWPGHIRVTARPARRIEAFLERLGELSAAGQFDKRGFPRPLAAARVVLELGDQGPAARPPLKCSRRSRVPWCGSRPPRARRTATCAAAACGR